MYQCCSCGSDFSRPRRYREQREAHFGFAAREFMEGCPRCGAAFWELPEEPEEDEESEEYQEKKQEEVLTERTEEKRLTRTKSIEHRDEYKKEGARK